MTRKTNILVVSLIAMLSVGAVRAETATVSYVNTQDAKLADRIKTQDTRIGTIRDWVNPLKDGSRATLATTEQDAYRAINELKEAIDNVPAQVNADWNEADSTKPAYIANKPTDLVTESALDAALAGKQDTLQFDTTPTVDSEKMVTSGAVRAAINAAQLDGQVDLTGYATETYVDNAIDAIDIPDAQVQSDWNATSGMGEILNKPDLTQYATTSDLADKQNALTEAQLAAVNSGVTSTTVAQVAANTQAIAIQDQALATKANTADLATVATSGDYADLTNKPTIPAAQVNADWNAESGVAQILNKPTIPGDADIVSPSELETALADKQDKIDENNKLPASNVDGLATVATSGDYADLTNKPEIPEQVKSDWTEADDTKASFILNKPTNLATTEDLADYVPSDVLGDGFDSENTVADALADKQDKIDSEHKLPASNVDGLATVATSGSYNDLANKPEIPAAQVQSDWAQADSNEVDFIKNKPTNLATETYVDEKVADVVAGDMSEALSAYVKKSEVEASLSDSSTNPVQNLVVTGALGAKVPFGNVPQLGQYVLGFVDGVQTYIPIVDANGNSGQPVVAVASEPSGDKPSGD